MSLAPNIASRTSEPIRVLRPVIVPAQFLVAGPLIAGFLAFFPGFFTFVISNMIDMSFTPALRPGLVAYAVAFGVILGLLGLKAFLEPGRTSYTIYADRVEFEEGLFNRQRSTVLLDRIVDVHMTEGVLQRTAGAGSVTLVTQQLVSVGEGSLTNRSFHLRNVPDPVGVYNLLRSLTLGGQAGKPSLPE